MVFFPLCQTTPIRKTAPAPHRRLAANKVPPGGVSEPDITSYLWTCE